MYWVYLQNAAMDMRWGMLVSMCMVCCVLVFLRMCVVLSPDLSAWHIYGRMQLVCWR